MIRLRIGDIPVRIHPLMPLLIALAWHMGAGPEALAYLPALLGHEAAHAVAARLCGLQIEEMELTPLGAAARLRSPWNAGAGRIAIAAMAGPAANFAMLCAVSTAAYAGWIAPDAAWRLIRANILLMLVNLVPALPLDGGRALCALLTGRLGVMRAVRIGIWGGVGFAALLAGAAIWTGLRRGVWNIAVFAAAVYIAACALREKEAAAQAGAESLICRRDELRRRGTLPVRLLAVSAEMPVSQALRLIRPGSVHVFRLYDDAMQPAGEISEGDLLRAFPALAAQPLSGLLRGGAHVRQRKTQP